MHDYILNNLLNQPASHHFRQLLDDKFDSISTIPDGGAFLGNILEDISPLFSKFQRRLAKKYVIIYKYFEEDSTALVTHVFHETQDYQKLFQNQFPAS